MKSLSLRSTIALMLLAGLFAVSGCAKKAVEQPPAPVAAAPTPSTPAPTPPVAPDTTAPAPATPSPGAASGLQPVFFDYDSDAIREDARATLDRNARILRDNPTLTITIEGHADERGTAEYNQSLGERRAQAAREYLVNAGIPESRLRIISYGKERPFAEGHDESAWAQNRRAHFVGS